MDMSDPNLDAKIFEKQLDDNLNFAVIKAADRFGGGIGFIIEHNGNREAQIVFTPKGGDLEMTHREVQSQELGIGGTTLLKKIEEYFGTLNENGILPPELKHFSIDAGQVGVIEWALNNGYEFENKDDVKLFEKIITGKGNKEYIVTDLSDDNLFSSYVFKKEVFDNNKDKIINEPSIAKNFSVRFKLKKRIPEEKH